MRLKEFAYYVEEHIRDFLPEEIRKTVSVSVNPSTKINDTVRYGLMIRRENEGATPVIYLEAAWKAHIQGAEMETVLRNLAEIYQVERKYTPSNVDMPLDYKTVRDNVTFQVVNKEMNKSNLKERIYTDIGQGLVKMYDIYQKFDSFGKEGSIAITHDLVHEYGYDIQEIRKDAEQNTPRIYPASFTGILQTLFIKQQEEDDGKNPLAKNLFVLSNEMVYFGAGALFYQGMQKRLAERFEADYYVLPSSVHEVLVIPKYAGFAPEELELIVRDVNQGHVSRKDFLSNKVLYYDREKDQLRTALPDIPDLLKGRRKEEISR